MCLHKKQILLSLCSSGISFDRYSNLLAIYLGPNTTLFILWLLCLFITFILEQTRNTSRGGKDMTTSPALWHTQRRARGARFRWHFTLLQCRGLNSYYWNTTGNSNVWTLELFWRCCMCCRGGHRISRFPHPTCLKQWIYIQYVYFKNKYIYELTIM